MPRLCGNAYHGIGNPNVWQGITGQPEPACVYVTEVLAHYRATGDRRFLDAMWPSVKEATAWARKAKTALAAPFIIQAASAAAAMARIENEPELAHELESELSKQNLPAKVINPPANPLKPESARRIYTATYRYTKNAWGVPAGMSMTFDKPPVSNESDMSALAMWTFFRAITGTTLNVPDGRLTVSPQLLSGMTELHAPVFFARFWAWLDCSPKQFRLKIVQHFGEPLELRELAAGAHAAAIRLPEPFVARAGASLDLSPWRGQLCEAKYEPQETNHDTLRWSREGIGTLLWSTTAVSDEPFPPSDAFDGYRETRWETTAQGRTSDWFQLDLGEVRQPARIEAATTPGVKLRVEFSGDGHRWQTLPTTTAAGTNGLWSLDWTAGPVRFIKWTPARDMDQPWQIRELWVK